MKWKTQPSESLLMASSLAVAGGCLDAYTYLMRGGVFANAQTGNIVLLGISLAKAQWVSVIHYLLPIISFMAGVMTADFSRHIFQERNKLHWRQYVVLIQAAILSSVIFIPDGKISNDIANILVSFVAAVQTETFRKIKGRPFASTMCTGNLRSGTESLFMYFRKSDSSLFKRATDYYVIIASFIAGAMIEVTIIKYVGHKSIILAVLILAAAFTLMHSYVEEGENS